MARQFDRKLSSDWLALRHALGTGDLAAAERVQRKMQSNARMQLSSASSYKPNGGANKIDPAAVNEAWKIDAMHYFETIPEVAQIVETTAKTVAACALRVGYQNEDVVLEPSDDPELSVLLKKLEGPSGDYHQIMYWIAMNLQITGDGYLVAAPEYDQFGTKITDYTDWEFVSVEELSINEQPNSKGSRVVVRNATGKVRKFNYSTLQQLGEQQLDPDYYIARGWRRSVRYSQLSDSSLRKNLGICKLLTKLTDLINAIADSQVPAGLLLVPEELSLGPADEMNDGADPEDDNIDALTEEIIEYLSVAVEDRSSAASLAPLIMRGKAEFLEKVQFIRLSRDLDAQTREIREELLDRLAQGMDAPKELIQGKGALSHWTGFQTDADFASKHVVPLGQLIADFLTRCYLWPMLEKRIRDGHSRKQLEDVKHWRLIFDPANIVARVDMATQAIKLFDRGVLSERALLATAGFELKDARTADERRQTLILDLIKTSPVTLAPVLLPLIDGLEHVVNYLPTEEDGTVRNERAGESGGENIERKVPKETNTDAKAPRGTKTPESNPRGKPPVEGQDKIKLPGHPGEDGRNPTTSRADILDTEEFATLISGLTSLAHAAKVRAVEKAGSRLVNMCKKDPELKATFAAQDKTSIVKSISRSQLSALGTTHDELLRDSLRESYDDIYAVIRAWFEVHFELYDDELESVARNLGAEYVETLVDFTVSTVEAVDHRFDNGLTVPSEIARNIVSTYINASILV